MLNGFSVIMPVYNQAYFIRRAISSLLRQTFTKWELIIIDDGSTDETAHLIEEYISMPKITYLRNSVNQGLGQAVNRGLERATYSHIAYLPADDFYFDNHLESLASAYRDNDDAVLVFSGLQCSIRDTFSVAAKTETKSVMRGHTLQLVQSSHLRTTDRWTERGQWEDPSLFVTFWHKLLDRGHFLPTNEITCFWTQHPHQRHRLLSEERGGGLNIFRGYYNVTQPLKIKVHDNRFTDEEKLYQAFRGTPHVKADGLKILMVGELAYNPERVYALEEAGHKLYGLWISKPTYCFNTVGPLPFGHIEEVNKERWEEEIKAIKPDIIYGLLNYPAVPLAYEVMRKNPDIPFVWHFKEGPTVNLSQGEWSKLMYLYANADGKIYLHEYLQAWIEQFIPRTGLNMILDGDLPKKDYFSVPFSEKLSAGDGAVHTMVAGRIIGINPHNIKTLAKNDIHVHFYNENYFNSREGICAELRRSAPHNFHVHRHCPHTQWVEEFSKYDAGWMHCMTSRNNGDISQASWDDLNIPARLGAYAAGGIPVILRDNSRHLMTSQQIVERHGIGILFSDFQDLANKLKDRRLMETTQQNMRDAREFFFFDTHADKLITFFRNVIKTKNDKRRP